MTDRLIRNAPMPGGAGQRRYRRNARVHQRLEGIQRMTTAQLIPVASWAASIFGEHCPHRNTLLNWIRNGKIRPTPRKIGRSYYCAPDATYEDPSADKIDRILSGR